MRYFLLGFLLLWMNALAVAQTGTLAGKVTDKKTSEGVIGATVLVTGSTTAAPVNVDGTYTLPLEPGTYSITMTYVGYKPLTFPGVVIKSGETTTLNGLMEESATSLTEVTVTGVKQTGTEVALIQDLKKSEVVVSGMSNDQIVKTLDRDAAEVVKRIPGVTVQNNNFIVIRGLAERYNTVLLNDALTPSAEVDTRSFSFDILPSAVIDRVLIFKSGAPELPGEFGGGVVKVYTKNSVLENTTSFTVSGWARNGTTFKDGYQQAPRGSTDWLGFDNGDRKLPDAIDSQPRIAQGEVTPAQQQAAGLSLRNVWRPTLITAVPDLRASLGLTRKFEIGSLYLSNVTSISYANTREQYYVDRQRFDSNFNEAHPEATQIKYTYLDQRAQTSSRLGVIHNWQARLNDHNRVEFRNFLNQYGTDEAIHRVGMDLTNGTPFQELDNYSLHYQSRTIYSGQLGGTHDLGAAKTTTATWATGYNYVLRDEPDYRRFRTQRDQADPGQPAAEYRIIVSPNGTQDCSSYYSKLRENTYMLSGQLEKRLRGRDSTRANEYKLRAGFYTEYKERNYDSRFFAYVKTPGFRQSLSQPIEQLFAPANINPNGGLRLEELTQPVDRYRADNTLAAAYVSAVAPISDKFNVSGGVRMEYNRKFLRSGDDLLAPYQEKTFYFLPSLNAAFNFTERSLVRLGTSLSVNRPEFREIASYGYYDFNTDALISGNPNLRTAKIFNADLRYEFYPTRSEMLSVGVFYKHFTDAIEQVTPSTNGSALTLSYLNSPSAYDVGVEVEVRKGLLNMTENKFLQHFSVVLNSSFIQSRVTLDEAFANTAANKRPLQGQSPYVVNTGVFYQDTDRRWQVSAQYNVIGPRILFASSSDQNYSVFDLPRHVIDLAVTKGLGSHLDLRLGVQDLLNQYVRQYYDFNRDGAVSSSETGAFGRYHRGQYSTIGLTYKL